MERRFARIFRYLSPRVKILVRGPICGREMGARESLVARGPARCLTIKLGFWCCFAAATLAAVGGAHAQSTDDSLRIYAGRHLARPATIVGTRTRRIFGQGPSYYRRPCCRLGGSNQAARVKRSRHWPRPWPRPRLNWSIRRSRAREALTAKNSLTASDARLVEDAFERRLSELPSSDAATAGPEVIATT